MIPKTSVSSSYQSQLTFDTIKFKALASLKLHITIGTVYLSIFLFLMQDKSCSRIWCNEVASVCCEINVVP